MKWHSVFKSDADPTADVLHLQDEKFGFIGSIIPARKVGNADVSWEIEFSVEDMELYFNDIIVGDLEVAKQELLHRAITFLDERDKEISQLSYRLRNRHTEDRHDEV